MRIHHLTLALGLLSLTGCGKDAPGDSGKLCETCDCIAHPDIDAQWPESGATGVYNRTRLYMVVDDEVPFPTSLVFTDSSGAVVPGTSTFDPDESIATFVPDSALASDSTYTVTRQTNECDADSFEFTTGPIGTEVADLNSLVGRTWRMDLGAGKPPPDRDGLAAVNDQINEDLLISATAVSGTTLTLLVASSETGDNMPQDLCVPTIEVALDLTQNPYGTGDVPPGYAPLSGEAVPTFGGKVEGSFSADGTVLAGIDLTMVLDMEAAGQILGDPQLCGTLKSVGVQCEPCPSGSGECLTFNTWGVDGVEDSSATVVEVTSTCR